VSVQDLKPGTIVLPTGYFPPVAYFAYLAGGRPVLIEQEETFPKQTYRNRCEIMTVSGKSSLIVPVSKPSGNHSRTSEIQISFREHWQRKHWRALQTAYNSSPYFSYYSEKIEQLLFNQKTLLSEFNLEIIRGISELLNISFEIRITEEYHKDYPNATDLRTTFSPKKQVKLAGFPSYPQVFNHLHGFLPNLSILDLLFNLGPESRNYVQGLRFRVED
jgi:hypothetical protein